MLSLPLARYRFEFHALDPGVMRGFGGSAWRGAFGIALKRVVCAMRLRPCEGCPLRNGCAYPILFDGYRPAERLASTPVFAGIDKFAVPYVLEPEIVQDHAFASGDRIGVILTLVGAANARFVYVVRAMAEAGAAGVGPARARMDLQRVLRLTALDAATGETVFDGGAHCVATPVASPPLPPMTGGLKVEFRTPLRLRLDNDLVTPERFTPAHLIGAAIRRVSSLAALHADSPIIADYAGLRSLAQMAVLSEPALRWKEQTRYSSRQGGKMQMGGIVGTSGIDLGPGGAEIAPWLALGQWVGVGKSASMGLGKYRITQVAT